MIEVKLSSGIISWSGSIIRHDRIDIRYLHDIIFCEAYMGVAPNKFRFDCYWLILK